MPRKKYDTSVERSCNVWRNKKMAKTRALKDVAQDPLAKNVNPAVKFKDRKPAGNPHVFKTLAVFLVGLAGGYITGRFFRIGFWR